MLVAQDFHAPSFNTGKRLSKTGRPDKKQRRNMEESMGEGEG
jgi:hypothetical protein